MVAATDTPGVNLGSLAATHLSVDRVPVELAPFRAGWARRLPRLQRAIPSAGLDERRQFRWRRGGASRIPDLPGAPGCISVLAHYYVGPAVKNHRTISPRQEAASERALFQAVLTLRNVEECRDFFRDLCTPAELQALADRWSVVGLLQQGIPYREIHRLTGVSVTTIGRVARFLGAGNGGYVLAARRLAER